VPLSGDRKDSPTGRYAVCQGVVSKRSYGGRLARELQLVLSDVPDLLDRARHKVGSRYALSRPRSRTICSSAAATSWNSGGHSPTRRCRNSRALPYQGCRYRGPSGGRNCPVPWPRFHRAQGCFRAAAMRHGSHHLRRISSPQRTECTIGPLSSCGVRKCFAQATCRPRLIVAGLVIGVRAPARWWPRPSLMAPRGSRAPLLSPSLPDRWWRRRCPYPAVSATPCWPPPRSSATADR
jgi:hypothetical protein